MQKKRLRTKSRYKCKDSNDPFTVTSLDSPKGKAWVQGFYTRHGKEGAPINTSCRSIEQPWVTYWENTEEGRREAKDKAHFNKITWLIKYGPTARTLLRFFSRYQDDLQSYMMRPMRIDESGGEKRVPAQMTDDQLYEHFSSTVNASFEKYYNTTSVPYSALVNIEETIERLEQSIADDIKETYVIPRTENPVDINAG